jgi:hypothetical protein
MKAAIARMVAEESAKAVAKALKDRDRKDADAAARFPHPSPRVPPNSQIVNGMVIRRSPRTMAELEGGKCEMSRFERAGRDHADKRKIKERSVVAPRYKFKLLDFGKMDKDGASALGSQVLAAKCAMSGLKKWMKKFDVAHILSEFPDTLYFSDPITVAHSNRIDVTKQDTYRGISVEQMAEYQGFVHEYMSPTDVESSEWLFDQLQLSIDSNLLVQLNQAHEAYPEVQQGGVLFFKLLVDAIDRSTYESIELYQDYLKTYRLDDTDGEDVATSLACFIAVVSVLEQKDRPSNLVRKMLEGQQHCHNKDYVSTVSGLLGSIKGPMFSDYILAHGRDETVILHRFADTLKTEFIALQNGRKWKPPSKNGGFYKAQIDQHRRSNGSQVPPQDQSRSGMVAPRPGWQDWFDSFTCSKCGGRHPDKYHDDPGIRDRWFKPSTIKSGAKHRANRPNPQGRNPRIQSGRERDFQRRVYQVFEEFVHDEDKDLLSRMADTLEMEHINIADATEDNEPPRGDDLAPDEDPEEEPPASALAAMTLDSLLNYRAA